ncbi:DUF3048 domain-containing protein [Herpetosiphon llansteffanensis]|uniref:DUF3048 domain-containing protein n=1 Tax=Herpetosiphon llansteffanensis TaxID=2094568 RepID=UPI00196B25F4|nr:DUF3048 domain-containing protein [Herpetosiphon llansteffanensis]
MRRWFFIILLLILAACSTTGAPTATVPAQPSPTATTPPSPTLAPTSTTPPSPTPVPTATPISSDPRTGRPAMARGTLRQRPYITMIDNFPAAYPQTGLDQAAIVFEALAEYGVTRYMAVFTPDLVEVAGDLGPVRSARLYFVQWAMGFRAVYTHAGGSPEGLERLAADDNDLVIDIDLVSLEDRQIFDYSRRSLERDAPHNLYTSAAEIAKYVADRASSSAQADVSEVGYLFAPEVPVAEPISTIDYFFIYPDDPAGWRYDPDTNEYARLRRGRPHIDAVSEQQLTFKSIVTMEVFEAPIIGDDKGRIDQQVVGEGRALVFANGSMQAATWRKASESAPLRFYDSAEAEIIFPAGPIWIAAMPSLENVTYE